MYSPEVFAIARQLVQEGLPSRNRALDRYRDPDFRRAAGLARHLRALTADLERLPADEVAVDLVQGGRRLRFRYAVVGGRRAMYVDAYAWSLIRDDPRVAPWRHLERGLREAARQ